MFKIWGNSWIVHILGMGKPVTLGKPQVRLNKLSSTTRGCTLQPTWSIIHIHVCPVPQNGLLGRGVPLQVKELLEIFPIALEVHHKEMKCSTVILILHS